MKVVVFGASGFVGGWICEELNALGGIDLHACVRRWAASARIARRGIKMSQVDLDSGDDLLPVLSGADAVINAAVPSSASEPTLALRLYEACAQAGVPRFVQFSSAAVYGDLVGDVNEEKVSPIDEYGLGKVKMERLLLDAAAKGGPQLTILRPSIVYGPFSESWTVRYAQRIARGRWRGLGVFGEGTCNLIHAHDVARAAILAATSSVTPGSHVLNINGPEVVSWNEYIERFGDALNVQDRVTPSAMHLSAMISGTEFLRVGGKFLKTHFNSLFRKIGASGRAGPAVVAGAKSAADLYPNRSELQLIRRRVTYNSERAVHELDFRPSISLLDGLKQSAEWCRSHGVVN
ncbi:nucleoside-diphosphate-sugar epimerase [Bradyrhizobium sp. LB1.3]